MQKISPVYTVKPRAHFPRAVPETTGPCKEPRAKERNELQAWNANIGRLRSCVRGGDTRGGAALIATAEGSVCGGTPRGLCLLRTDWLKTYR